MSWAQSLWKQYEEALDTKPLLMKALTSMVGFALGDILAQLFIQKNENFDYARLFRLASFGFLIHAGYQARRCKNTPIVSSTPYGSLFLDLSKVEFVIILPLLE